MRFLVLSDVHGRAGAAAWANRLAEENDADAFLVLGDITHFGEFSSGDAAGFLRSLSRDVYAIPGNCDMPWQILEQIESSATCLHERRMEIGGSTFVGLGGSNPTIFDTPFELSEEEMEAALRPLMSDGVVLATHAPALGYNDTIPQGAHVGSEAVLRIVREFKPRAVVSGHIHEARGIIEEGGTLFLNPGPARDGFSALLDVDEASVRAKLLDQAR